MYEALAAAIIEKAFDDYCKAKRNIQNKVNVERSQWVIKDVERFVKSEWFGILSNLDKKYILAKIQVM